MHALMLVVLLLAAPVVAGTTRRVFDKNGNVTEIWKEGDGVIEVYNKDWTRKGYIKEEGQRFERYDKDWRRRGNTETGKEE